LAGAIVRGTLERIDRLPLSLFSVVPWEVVHGWLIQFGFSWVVDGMHLPLRLF
jgi:hypothetical protein